MQLKKKPPVTQPAPALPVPAPDRAGSALVAALAVLALLAVGGAAFWLTRDDDTRLKWREEAAVVLDRATEGSPFAGAGQLLRTPPPPLPAAVTAPATAPGTLAGQAVQAPVGTVPAASGAGVASNAPAASGAGVVSNAPAASGAGTAAATSLEGAGRDSMPAVPKVTEDSRVRGDMVEDLAAFVVSRYKPGPGGGALHVGVQSLNQRYGLKLAAPAGGRSGLLRYAFQPTMLRGLYGLYADRFLQALNRQALSRGFTPEQIRQLRMALAGRLVMLAGGLEGVAAIPDLRSRLEQVDKAGQQVVDINAQMAEAVFALDELRDRKAKASQVNAAALRVEGLSARYRRALEQRAAASRTLAALIRQNGGQALDEDTLVFLAQWVARRQQADPQALDAVRAAASILRDLSQRSARGDVSMPPAAAPTAQPAPRQTQNALPATAAPLPATGPAPSRPRTAAPTLPPANASSAAGGRAR